MKPLLFAGLVLASLLAAPLHAAPAATAPSVDPHAGETPAQRDKRMRWWREARFGMFIHWGLYAQLGGTWGGRQTGGAGEWIMHDLKIPVADYDAQARQFDPEQFRADEWVRVARDAGMKYIVMTAKHHEGFAMFHTGTDGYNISDATPFRRDPIAEMAAACRKQGLKFGVYYSQAQDWHHPGGAAYGGHWDNAQDGDLHEYVRTIAAPQVRELLTKYHPAVLWWDTPVEMSPLDIRELTAAFPQDPGMIANNRLGNGVPGDTETPEQFIPATGYPGRDWETCMTINDTWGYKSFDTNFKSGPTLIRNLIDIASKGGNYLLNVGPDGRGVIPAGEVERLREMGAWMKVNHEAIYGTSASPFKHLPFDGRVTRKGDTLYLHVFAWPDSGLTLPGLATPARDAKALATGQRLTAGRAGDGSLTISKPDKIDPVATVVALRLAGPPVVEPAAIAPQSDGSYQLTAEDADVHGGTAKLESSGGGSDIGYWTDAKDTVSWTLSVPAARAGEYRATLEYACEPGSEGSTLALQVDDGNSGVTGTVAKTAGWGDYQTAALGGALTLPAGAHVLRVVPTAKPGLAVMNLRRITLIPIAGSR
ncbi:MAG: alpha-L-fucosidase [Armatimonadetes bacterium]|nr:alpha-L-fucosidase [Armatimonadota bacterium]